MAAAEKKRIKSGRTTFSDDDDEVDEGGFREHAAPALTISQHLMDFFAARCKMLVPVVLFIFLLMLLVWDMKTTSILSDIIHDDHTNLWEKMDATMLAKWLSPLDLCMLKIDQKNMSIKAFRQKNCSKLHDRSSGESAPRLFCSIGSSLGKPCTAPLSTRSFFTSRLLGPLGDADNFALKTSLRRLALQKKALVFIGDAISKQNQEATLCELLRTDQISITGGGGHHDSNSTISEFGISWIDQPSLSMDVIFMHIAHLDIAHHHKGRRKLSDGSNFDTDIDGIHRRNDHRKLDLLIDEHHKLNATNYAQNEPSLTLLSASAHMENFSHQYPGGMMIVANIGVWYNSREKFRKDLPVFLRWLEDLGVENTVLFRETAAQHWNHTENGYFALDENVLEDSSCVSMADSREELDWRNRDVKFTIENEGFKHIRVIPFRDITAPLHDMHPDGHGSRDCTRYCYFPQMWQSVWLTIDDASKNADAKIIARKK